MNRNLRSGPLTMAIKSNTSNEIYTGRYHTRPLDRFRQFHRRGRLTGVRRSIVFVNAAHYKNANRHPASIYCPTVAPTFRLQPRRPVVRFLHVSGMWLFSTKERGPSCTLFPAPLSACDFVYSSTVRMVAVPVGGDWTKTTRCEHALGEGMTTAS
jgi:hypothetical protein